MIWQVLTRTHVIRSQWDMPALTFQNLDFLDSESAAR
jgi:hypothetical protein